jgi:hypothetical protein
MLQVGGSKPTWLEGGNERIKMWTENLGLWEMNYNEKHHLSYDQILFKVNHYSLLLNS